MSLLIECTCGKKLKVRAELAGKKVKCPGCGTAVLVLTPAREEHMDAQDMIQENPPPTKPSAKTPSTDVKPRPAAWDAEKPVVSDAAWDKKKKPSAARKKAEDEDDDEDKPTPYWLFPGTLSTEVMALASEGIYFASLKGDALKRAEKLMKNCTHAAIALGEKAVYVPWEWIVSIYSNKRLVGFTIHHTGGDEPVLKAMTPADHAMRDAIFEKITEYLGSGWIMTTEHLTPLTATFVPLICIGIDVLVTVGLAFLSYGLEDGPGWQGRGRGAAVAMLLNLLQWLGPLGTVAVGFVVAAMLGIWLFVRIAFPPIEMSIHPRPADAVEDE